VLGVAYKRDIDDVRESPALDILRILARKGAELSFVDPWVPSVALNGETLEAREPSDELFAAQDCVVIVTDHSTFDYEQVVGNAPLVFDTRNATGKLGSRENVVRL
jgi:UDP-N-acetyl-D-glucosamine dehydrogenase